MRLGDERLDEAVEAVELDVAGQQVFRGRAVAQR
jgi:hypothetical protein